MFCGEYCESSASVIEPRSQGNIMLNDEGHVLHVDFGFMLCGAPGGKAQ